MRKRVGALIIQNQRLLLVSQRGTEYDWTPGGTQEEDETDLQTLRRELDEELGLKVKSTKFYEHMEFSIDNVISEFYIVEVTGVPTPSNEVSEMIWYSRQNFEDKKPPISSWLIGKIVPRLIEERYL